jgi:hypothetical protein
MLFVESAESPEDLGSTPCSVAALRVNPPAAVIGDASKPHTVS